MKNILLVILCLLFSIVSAQNMKIESGTSVYVKDGNSLYSDLFLKNQGSIKFENTGDLYLDAGFNNQNADELTLNNSTLHLGSNTSRANGNQTATFKNDDTVKKVVLGMTSGSYNVAGGLLSITETFTSNSGTLNANDYVVLKSTSVNNTAIVSESNGGVVNGICVERFIPVLANNSRAFRFLTSAVDSDDPIFDNWQESGNSPSGFGTHITGSTTGSNGFDSSITGNPSMYTFDNSFTGGNLSDAWDEIPNTNNRKLFAGEAYRIFIRGDRNYDLDSNPADVPNSNVNLRTTGSLAIGNQTETLSNISGFYNMVGNPYQAYININDLNLTNLNTNFYWIWDPNLSPSGQKGAYVAVPLPNGIPVGSSDASQLIQPGQSFFVQTLIGSAADITFTESSKDDNATPTQVFSNNNQTSINLLLYTDQALNNDDKESDALGINFSFNANNGVDQMDAGKMGNPDENLARFNNGNYISIESREMPVDGESLELFTNGYTESSYTFVANVSNLPNDIDAFLVDSYTGYKTLLSNGANQISFTIDASIPENIASDRFSLNFEVETFGIDDNENIADFKVYPNPVTDNHLTITSSKIAGNDVEVNLYNIMGQNVLQTQGIFKSNNEMKLNLRSYQDGVYLLEVSGNGQTGKEMLIIKQ